MDKAIAQSEISRRNYKRYLYLAVAAAVIIVLLLLIRSLFAPTVDRNSITTAVAQKGNIENTLTASGVVVPEFEEVITSSVNASVQRVLLDAGSAVKKGQSVLLLDKSASQLQYENGLFQLELKRNNIRKMRLELNKSFYDLQSNNTIKQLRINSLEAAVENARRLFKAGGGTREDIEQATMNLQVAQQEKKQLENEITTRQQSMKLDIQESELAAKIQANELKELERKLALADVVASRAGVVTWVNRNIGAAINEGEPLARIADLGSFKINGSISDDWADQIRTGLPVIVKINDSLLRGTIANIHPAVENNILSFDVQLARQHQQQLRPNQKLDIYLVTASHENIVRVANGAAFKSGQSQDVFVVRDHIAYRRRVVIGLASFDYVEVVSGIQPGETVITSDMRTYDQVEKVTIKH
ncbi:efflux RND transporter periplasmic adaptor subunit [Chitinophaga sp. sic0106]|uniref:efflux RND transporter periplasmic adaptor subunit n=1 Tax=Chitinophaga sp. sic0106 TaxID=2854785 RepID=UPI001C471F7E|nr:HlyD family efflux transporter periplasmic adaptor subunit [Chitinophaga sp. sic0106]MBV7529711.1 HlyD family efflux transporter periplasmic adaptor subunit [Chitinophaga sp. sic0106]